MIVVDTSAWIELFRDRGHPVGLELAKLIESNADLAITEPVLMEVLAGAGPGEAAGKIRSRLMAFPVLRLEGITDFEEAASIYRACRDAGRTLSSQIDCLIAVPTIRHEASLLHSDGDFDAIARQTRLKIHLVSS